MNQIELERALETAGVPTGDYSLPDLPPNGLGGGVTVVLDRDGDKWVTYFIERGERYGDERFDEEDSACRHIHDLLTRPRRARRGPLTADEIENAKHLEEQDQHEYQQWLASRRGDPETGPLAG